MLDKNLQFLSSLDWNKIAENTQLQSSHNEYRGYLQILVDRSFGEILDIGDTTFSIKEAEILSCCMVIKIPPFSFHLELETDELSSLTRTAQTILKETFNNFSFSPLFKR